MTTEQFYHLAGPVEWATAPAVYSYTSLRQIEKCPLAWQLQNSKYAHFERYPVRPNPAGIEGEIVHEVVERLLREVAGQGMPVIASESFRKCIAAFDLHGSIGKAIEQHLEVVKRHPRGRGFRFLSSIQDIQNKVVRLFRDQYEKIHSAIDRSGAKLIKSSNPNKICWNGKNELEFLELLKRIHVLTEMSLTIESPPFKVRIDSVCYCDNNVVISDFKSSNFKNEYIEQLLIYSTVLFKSKNIITNHAYLFCIDRFEFIELDKNIIEKIYLELTDRISYANNTLKNSPVTAVLNESCAFCPVRQFCDKYWEALLDTRQTSTKNVVTDVEILVEGVPTEYGLNGKLANGKSVNVVYGKDVWKIHGPFIPFERLRILGGILQTHSVELKTWSEIFRCGIGNINDGTF